VGGIATVAMIPPGVGETVGVGVSVGGSEVCVEVGMSVSVGEGTGMLVSVGEGMGVSLAVGGKNGVGLSVGVMVAVGSRVGVMVSVGVGFGVQEGKGVKVGNCVLVVFGAMVTKEVKVAV
jgi:hypothetical protein